MTVVIVVPVLARPHRVEPLLASIEQSTSAAHRTLFVCSPGDDDEIAAIDRAGADHVETPVAYPSGDYARKVNLAYQATTEPFLFLAADDLLFHPGWLDRARERLDPGVGVVGTNDLGNRRVLRGEHSTHSLVTRSYVDEHGTIDEPGKVLHEGYLHNWVDTEFVQTALHRGAYAHAADAVVEHLHPHWNKAALDSTYERGLSGFERDRRVFQRRQQLWH